MITEEYKPKKIPPINFLGIILSRTATLSIQTWKKIGCPEVLDLLHQVFILEQECDIKRQALVDSLYNTIPAASSPLVRHKLLDLKRRIYGHWEPLTQYLLDITSQELPAELWEDIKNFDNLLNKRINLLKQTEELFEKSFWRIRKNLLEIIKDPFIQEGIFLSSYDLWKETARYFDNPPQPASISKSQKQFEKSIIQHLGRHCAKTTPRAILTAIQIGQIDCSRNQSISVNTQNNNQKISRRKSILTWPVVWNLAKMVSEQKDAWRYVVPRVNPTLHYERNKELKFWRHDKKEDVLCKLTPNDVMQTFVKKTELRYYKADELIKQVQQEHPEHSLEELTEYYLQLTKSGLLIGHFEIPFAYYDGLPYLIRLCKNLPEGILDNSIITDLERISELLQKIDEEK